MGLIFFTAVRCFSWTCLLACHSAYSYTSLFPVTLGFNSRSLASMYNFLSCDVYDKMTLQSEWSNWRGASSSIFQLHNWYVTGWLWLKTKAFHFTKLGCISKCAWYVKHHSSLLCGMLGFTSHDYITKSLTDKEKENAEFYTDKI